MKINPSVGSFFYGTILATIYSVWAWVGLLYSALGMDPLQHVLIQKFFYLSPVVLFVATFLIFRRLKSAPQTFKFSKLLLQFLGVLIAISIMIELIMYPWAK